MTAVSSSTGTSNSSSMRAFVCSEARSIPYAYGKLKREAYRSEKHTVTQQATPGPERDVSLSPAGQQQQDPINFWTPQSYTLKE